MGGSRKVTTSCSSKYTILPFGKTWQGFSSHGEAELENEDEVARTAALQFARREIDRDVPDGRAEPNFVEQKCEACCRFLQVIIFGEKTARLRARALSGAAVA